MQRIALIGLGSMGSGMGARLLKAGFPLVVYNRHPERAVALVQAGAQLASSPREVSEQAEVVISMVADDVASRSVWLGESGALAGAKENSVLIESSTLTPGWVRELADAAEESKCDFLDAPVTGSKPQAVAGELLFLVGGKREVLERVRPVLKPMSRDILYAGPTGSGALLKLLNNFLCGVQVASFTEALMFADQTGIDRERLLQVLLNGAPGSPLVKTVASRITNRDSTVNFALELMKKDLDYALNEANRHGASLQTAASARDLFETAVNRGFGRKDVSALYEALSQR